MAIERKTYLNIPLMEDDDGNYVLRRKKLVMSAVDHLIRLKQDLVSVIQYLEVLQDDLPPACLESEEEEDL